MRIYPALSSGASCQFPISKQISYRTISNTAEDGTRITLEDFNATHIRWALQYEGLSDAELAVFQQFFDASEGRLNSFAFIDPTANLLVWSEDLTKSAWQKSSLLGVQAGVADPLGTQRATRISNNTQGNLALVQTVQIPSEVVCCWSMYARSNSAGPIGMTRDSKAVQFAMSADWQRFKLVSSDSSNASYSDFAISIQAGGQVDLFGMQVLAQTSPSKYVSTLNENALYPETRFDSDTLPSTVNGPDSNSCTISLYSRTS